MPRDCDLCSETVKEDFATHLQETHKIKSEEILRNIMENKPLKYYDDGLHCSLCKNATYSQNNKLYDHVRKTHGVSNPEFREKLTKVTKVVKPKAKHQESLKVNPDSAKVKQESNKLKIEPRSKSKTAKKKNVTCRLCETKDIPELNHHLEIYHKITEKVSLNYILEDVKTAVEPVQLKCFLCGKNSFLTLVHMRRHLKDSHLVKVEMERKRFEAMWKEKSKPSFECAVRKECFPTESTLKRHKINHDIVSGYFCNKCEIEFDSIYDLLKHEKRHEKGQIYSCTMCEKKFTFAKELNQHLKSHKTAVSGGFLFFFYLKF